MIVAAHDNWHVPMSIAAVKAGKDVWRGGDGVVFHGSNGWIGNISDGFYASDQKLWQTEFKDGEMRLPVSPEHNRNFIDCVR